MSLTLDGHVFEVEQAELFGRLLDPYQGERFFWYLHMTFVQREIEGQPWSPAMYHQSVPFETRKWEAFEGRTFSWDTTRKRAADVWQDCGISIWEHEDIPVATLSFGARNGATFDVRWEGLSDFRVFDLEACVTFTGIQASGNERDNDKTFLKRLTNVLDAQDYIQHPMQVREFRYGTGLRLAESHFEPKLK